MTAVQCFPSACRISPLISKLTHILLKIEPELHSFVEISTVLFCIWYWLYGKREQITTRNLTLGLSCRWTAPLFWMQFPLYSFLHSKGNCMLGVEALDIMIRSVDNCEHSLLSRVNKHIFWLYEIENFQRWDSICPIWTLPTRSHKQNNNC